MRLPYALKMFHRNSFSDRISQNIDGQYKMGIMRALNYGNMVYLHKMFTCYNIYHLVMEPAFYDDFFNIINAWKILILHYQEIISTRSWISFMTAILTACFREM